MFVSRLPLLALFVLAQSFTPAMAQSPKSSPEPTLSISTRLSFATNKEAIAPADKVLESTTPVRTIASSAKPSDVEMAQLDGLRLTLRASQPLVLSDIIRAFSQQGLKVVSELPLDRYVYAGYSFSDVPAPVALKAVLGSVGLDFAYDANSGLVQIKPMPVQTWYLNLGNRKASYSTSQSTGQSQSENQSGSGDSAGALNTRMAATGTSSITGTEDFWASLKVELENRLKVSLPSAGGQAAALALQNNAGVGLPQPGSGMVVVPPISSSYLPPVAQSNNSKPESLGTFSINAETGAVSVQAPSWVLSDLDAYFTRIQDMYNTELTFSGELMMLNTSDSNSTGLDISAFGQFLRSKFGYVISNNALGGITFNPGTGAVSADNALPGAKVGIYKDGLTAFSGYLSNFGKINILQKPTISTTSGIPADFRRTIVRYFNTVSQQALPGTAGGAPVVGTQNTLQQVELGTSLRINPRFDISTGLIRAHIELVQSTLNGFQNVTQTLSTPKGNESVTTQIPVISRIIYSGEALLRDGDVVIMGGQTDSTDNQDRQGTTGLMDLPVLKEVFGSEKSSQSSSVFYFTLRVNIAQKQ